MGIRKDETYRNYSATELDEMRQADVERDALTGDFDVEQAKRAQVIVSGLVSKYGFSEAGAQQVMALIKRINFVTGKSAIESARFATEEKRQAALRAAEYYWK